MIQSSLMESIKKRELEWYSTKRLYRGEASLSKKQLLILTLGSFFLYPKYAPVIPTPASAKSAKFIFASLNVIYGIVYLF